MTVDQLEYFAWTSRQLPVHGSRQTIEPLPRDVRLSVGGTWIGDTWVPDGLEWSDWIDRMMLAAERMLADPRFGDAGSLSFGGRALKNVEMAAITSWRRYSLEGRIERWIEELYQELESKHGYCYRYEGEDAPEDQGAVDGAKEESESHF